MSTPRTYKEAADRLYTYLRDGAYRDDCGIWTVSSPTLKVRHATRQDGFRVWIKAQGVHAGYGSTLANARSLFVDLKAPVPEIMEAIERYSR